MSELEVMGECDRVDPWFDRGSFIVQARLGHRGRTRQIFRDFAATHKPPLRISISDAASLGYPDAFYVLVLGDVERG